MKREFTVTGICAVGLLAVVGYIPNNKCSDALVMIFMTGVVWAFWSAFRKA
jgi:hypothetical protein